MSAPEAGEAAAVAGYPLAIHSLGVRRFDRGYRFPEHVHVCHQLYLVLAGAVDYRVEGRLHRLGAGEGMLVASGLRREPRATSASGHVCIVSFHSPWPELGRPAGLRLRLDAATRAEALLLAETATRPGQVQDLRFHHLLLDLIGEEWFARLDRLPAEARGEADGLLVDRLETVLAANLDRPFTLGEMAALAGISAAQLGRLFHRHRGCAPVARHRELRLQAARRRLRGGREAVTAVALATGFASSQHLATAFRRRFGVPPSQARRLREQAVYMR